MRYLLASIVAASLMGGVSIAIDCKKNPWGCGQMEEKHTNVDKEIRLLQREKVD
tara:strand:- start:1872 stop:2033 length:162 start_codon:yes stop_codon:yes gene_type:complete